MKKQFHFYFKTTESPTVSNLERYLLEKNWSPCRFKWQADFSDANLQFDAKTALQLEYKHLLAKLAENHCPEIIPLTYCINDQNWPTILNQLAYSAKDQFIWILKPALLNNGKYIKIFQSLAELERHFLSANRLGGEHVLQRYLVNPHLLRDRRKYSIRMFVILTNYCGNFLYPNGYYNVALHPYNDKNFSDLRSHLTNEHLQEEEANVLQIPSSRFPEFPSIYSKIKAQVEALIKGLVKENPKVFKTKITRKLAIFGFDFLIDASGRLWLIEANHGPCFPTSDDHPLQAYLYYDFWQDFIGNFVLPIANKEAANSIRHYSFELLRKS